jgi:hypothetical protein
LELSSGLEEEVAFPGDADIIVGKTYHLSYSRTKLYRVIIVKNYTLTHEGSENGTAPHENKGDK